MVKRNSSSSSSSSSSSTAANANPTPPSPPIPPTVVRSTSAENPVPATASSPAVPLADDVPAPQPETTLQPTSSTTTSSGRQRTGMGTPRMRCPPKSQVAVNENSFLAPSSSSMYSTSSNTSSGAYQSIHDDDDRDHYIPSDVIMTMAKLEFSDETVECLHALDINTHDKLFAMEENELRVHCGAEFGQLLLFRTAKIAWKEAMAQTITPTLINLIPLFRGTGNKAIQEAETFLSRLENLLEISRIHPLRWPSLVTIGLVNPEDSAYWREYVSTNPGISWEECRAQFLSHFEQYDQRTKHVESLHTLAQKPTESIQRYFDSAADTIRKAQVNMDDPFIVSCVRRGIRNDELKRFIVHREEPQRSFTFHELRELALMGDDRLNLSSHTSAVDRMEMGFRPVCFHCKRPGHKSSSCRKRPNAPSSSSSSSAGEPAAKRQQAFCKNCPNSDHPSSKCPKKTCSLCKKPGHLHYACPTATCKACGGKGHTTTSFSCPKHPNNKDKNLYSIRSTEYNEKIVRELLIYEYGKMMSDSSSVVIAQLAVKGLQGDLLTVPLSINMHNVNAVLDTGATHSIVSSASLHEIGLEQHELVPTNETAVGAFIEQNEVPLWRTPPVEVLGGPHELIHSFLVGDIYTPVLIGMDLFSKLGLSISGLPYDFPSLLDDEGLNDVLSGRDDESHSVFQNLQRIPENELQLLMERIEDALLMNERIGEAEFCHHPSAVVQVELSDDTPIYRPQFEIPERLHSVVDEEIKKWVGLGKIEPCSQAVRWNSSLLVVPKQDLYGNKTDWRVCFDARAINLRLKIDTYGIPRIKEIFRKVQGFRYCSSLDLVSAYLQMPVEENDRDILSFTWRSQKYRFAGAPFGLTQLPGQFQRLMNAVLTKHHDYVCVYLDDVFIFSNTLTEHIEHCNQVINTLTKVNLRLRRGKCHFGFIEAVLLGHVISGSSLRADPRKLETFRKLKRPTTGKQLQAFLGFASYLREYVPNYAKVAAALERIKFAKDLDTHWGEEQDRCFMMMKDILSQPPILSTPDFDKAFLVATDSSQYGNGAVLYQEYDGKTHYIQFYAKALNKGQINYPATKRELLAIVQALKAFRYYLYGRHFDLYTDHKALTYLFTSKDPSYMMLNWMEQLLEFNFTVHHRPGNEMILPDALSRLFFQFRKTLKKGNESSQESLDCSINQVMVQTRCSVCKQRVARKCTTGLCNLHCTGCPIHPKVVAETSEPAVSQLELNLDENNPNRVQSLMKEFIKNVVNKKEPEDVAERQRLIDEEHATTHAGAEQLFMQLFRKGWYWSTMKQECLKRANSCDRCLQFNVSRQGYHPLHTITAALPFDHIAMDLGQVSTTSTRGNNFFIVITDICTRFSIVRALPNKSAQIVAQCLFEVMADFGLPKIIQSDNGLEFVNQVMKELSKESGFSHRKITSYHPQANGAAESHVKMVKEQLTKHTNGDWSEWCTYIPMIQLNMNTRITKRHKSTPFSLMFTRPFNEFADYSSTPSRLLTAEQMVERNQKLSQLLYPSIKAATDAHNTQMIDDFAISHKILTQGYPSGSMVMKIVDVRNAKTDPRYEGPFKVLEQTKHGAYTLLDATGAMYPKTVAPSQLKLISVPDMYLEDDTQYEVEKIIRHRGPTAKRQYLVKWKGYPESSNSWVCLLYTSDAADD